VNSARAGACARRHHHQKECHVPRIRTFQIDRRSVSTCLCFIYVSGACARRINSNRACFLTVSAVSYTLCCAGPVGVGAVPTGLNRSAGARCRVLRGLRSVSHLRRCAVLRRRGALYLYIRPEPVGRARCTCTNRPEPVGRALPALPLVSGCTVAQRGRDGCDYRLCVPCALCRARWRQVDSTTHHLHVHSR
jgi:hypothetical protein